MSDGRVGRSMTLDDALASVNRQLDVLYADAMIQTLDLLVDCGASPEELTAGLDRQHAAFEITREKALASMVAYFHSGTWGVH